MNFRNRRVMEEPEINFIPLIDLLLVILIFLMVTTTYNKMNGFQVALPEANAQSSTVASDDVVIAVTADGIRWNGEMVPDEELKLRAEINAKKLNQDNWVIIAADEKIDYAQVIRTMEKLNQSGITRITLQAETPQKK